MSSILIYKNEEQQGPFDMTTIQKGIKDGHFSVDDFAWQEGCADWVPLRTLLPAPPVPPTLPPMASRPKTIEQTIEDFNAAALSRLIGDDQNAGVVERVIKKAKDLLTRGEEIEYIGVQKKPLVTIAPDAVLLTNKRFMIVRPKLMGMTFEDHLWRDVSNVHMSEQMLTATITCTIVNGEKLVIDSIPKSQARRIYAFAQEVEERMAEHRWDRDMQEKRAAAGGVVIQSPISYPAQTAAPVADDPMAVLGKLKKMLDAGLIEPGEFESKKAEILSRM